MSSPKKTKADEEAASCVVETEHIPVNAVSRMIHLKVKDEVSLRRDIS
jgi:hypothetical protein